MKKSIIITIFFLIIFIFFLVFFVHSCDYIKQDNPKHKLQSCECNGLKITLKNNLDPTDFSGEKKSICIGRIKSAVCYLYPNSEGLDCNSI